MIYTDESRNLGCDLIIKKVLSDNTARCRFAPVGKTPNSIAFTKPVAVKDMYCDGGAGRGLALQKDTVEELIELNDHIDKIDEEWGDLDSDTQEALDNWYNQTTLDHRDKERLLKLEEAGLFTHFKCGACGACVHFGDPKDWSEFQGMNQSEHLGDLCADCAGIYLRLKEFADE